MKARVIATEEANSTRTVSLVIVYITLGTKKNQRTPKLLRRPDYSDCPQGRQMGDCSVAQKCREASETDCCIL